MAGMSTQGSAVDEGVAGPRSVTLHWKDLAVNLASHVGEHLNLHPPHDEVVLTCGGEEVRVHGVVLAALSERWRELLNTKSAINTRILHNILDTTIIPGVLKMAKELLYTGKVIIPEAQQVKHIMKIMQAIYIDTREFIYTNDIVQEIGWRRHAELMLSGFQAMCRGKLCGDAAIYVDGHVINVHKMVVGAMSPVLDGLFKINNGVKQLHLPAVSARSIQHLVTYMYFGQTSVHVDDLQDFKKLCRYFEVKSLKSFSSGLIEEQDEIKLNESPLSITIKTDIGPETSGLWERLKDTYNKEHSTDLILANGSRVKHFHKVLVRSMCPDIHRMLLQEQYDTGHSIIFLPRKDDQIIECLFSLIYNGLSKATSEIYSYVDLSLFSIKIHGNEPKKRKITHGTNDTWNNNSRNQPDLTLKQLPAIKTSPGATGNLVVNGSPEKSYGYPSNTPPPSENDETAARADTDAARSAPTPGRFGCNGCRSTFISQEVLNTHQCAIRNTVEAKIGSDLPLFKPPLEKNLEATLSAARTLNDGRMQEAPGTPGRGGAVRTLAQSPAEHSATRSPNLNPQARQSPRDDQPCAWDTSSKNTASKYELAHANDVQPPPRYECNLCSQSFASETHLLTHKQNVHHLKVRPFRCDVCHVSFHRKKTLAMHRRHVHGESVVKDHTPPRRRYPPGTHPAMAVTLEVADLEFVTEDNHPNTSEPSHDPGGTLVTNPDAPVLTSPHVKTFVCPECSEIFTDTESLLKHSEELNHANIVQPYWICGLCQSGFLQEDDLTNHLYTHSFSNYP